MRTDRLHGLGTGQGPLFRMAGGAASLRVLRCRGGAFGRRRCLRGQAREFRPRDHGRQGPDRGPGAGRGGRRGRDFLRAGRLRNLPHARDFRRAGPQGHVPHAGRAGSQRPVPAVLLACQVCDAGARSLMDARKALQHAASALRCVARSAATGVPA
ncbi:hypothetical protein VARIO8X_120518 [Burkholderiales bacterium 8X]|nr:hypothetical protein VARIO8X_120518 [Burkholderiales bacterium 8X]